MNSKRPKSPSKSTKSDVNAEAEWVVAEEGESSAEPRVEREPVDEPDIDVYQPGPDEPVWAPVEPAAASEAEGAPRVAKKGLRAAGAKLARVEGKAPKKATSDVATDAASANEEPAPSAPERQPKRASKRSATQPEAAEGACTQGDAGERHRTLPEQPAVEVATAATEPTAAGSLATKRKLQEFVERAEQLARERVGERAQERAGEFGADRAADFAGERAADFASEHAADRDFDRAQDRTQERADEWGRERAGEFARERAADLAADRSLERADDAPRPAAARVAMRKQGMQASEPATPIPTESAAAAPTDAPTEPASSLPSMEDYIAELATMSVPQLVKRHVEMLGKSPRIKNRVWLQRKLAWHEQTKRYGGLSTAAKKRLDELMGEIELPDPTSRAPKIDAPATRSADDLPLGTRLERRWRDRVIVATRVEGGWDCEGANYRTLSAAAKAVTQSHVSGPAFFGLWRPRKDAQ